jgi:hypothetical protein
MVTSIRSAFWNVRSGCEFYSARRLGIVLFLTKSEFKVAPHFLSARSFI